MALLLILLGTFGYLQFESRQPVTLLAPTGSYPVGRAIYDWTDRSRVDPFSPGASQARELSVWAWYPAQVGREARRAAYLPPGWQHAFQGTDFLHTRADVVTTHSWSGTPLARTRSPLPVLVFMPGFGRIAANYTTLAEDLASRGYAVFAVNPTYVSDDVVLDRGRVVPANPTVAEEDAGGNAFDPRDPIDARVTEVEAADLRFALDRATSLDRSIGDRFSGRLDVSRVGFFGHSIGGSAATRACQLEARCAGAANLDGAVFGPVVEHGMGKPYLFLGEDPSLSPVPKAELHGVVQGLPADRDRVLTVTGAGHMNFSDSGVLYKFPPHQLGAIGSIDGARALTIARAYLRAFFDVHVRGQSSSLLAAPSPPYPDVHPVPGFA
ncbi:MAG: alpha/beta hydrolase family protein [Candidatus Dormibacteraceae bacterium]